jgi:hypothetical protein
MTVRLVRRVAGPAAAAAGRAQQQQPAVWKSSARLAHCTEPESRSGPSDGPESVRVTVVGPVGIFAGRAPRRSSSKRPDASRPSRAGLAGPHKECQSSHEAERTLFVFRNHCKSFRLWSCMHDAVMKTFGAFGLDRNLSNVHVQHPYRNPAKYLCTTSSSNRDAHCGNIIQQRCTTRKRNAATKDAGSEMQQLKMQR